jgi:uncharacterized protein YceK
VQQTGNFKLIAVIMGCLLLGCGSLVAVLKPIAAWRDRKQQRAAAARDDDEEQQGGGHDSSCSPVLPARPLHADGLGSVDEVGVVSREPSACVLVGGLKDAAVGGGKVRTAGGTAALGVADAAVNSSSEAHRRPAAAQAQQQS